MFLPKKFEKKMKNILGSEYEEFKQSFDTKSYKGIRINTNKIASDVFIKEYPYVLHSIPWCKEGFYAQNSKNIKLGKHPYHHCGLYYIQEPSAMIPAEVLDPKPNEKILDICAAPGGKSTQIATKLNNTGVLVSNDISPKRVKSLAKNIKMMGFTNCFVVNETPEKLSYNFKHYFDKILVDAPCSGEGMFKRDPISVKKWNEKTCNKYHEMQISILDHIPAMLKSGGSIVYSTCTFSPEENEATINWFLEKFPDFYVDEIKTLPMLSNGIPHVIEADSSIENSKRAWPHKIEGDGHFVVRLKHNGDFKEKNYEISCFNKKFTPAPSEMVNKYLDFENEYLLKKMSGKFVCKDSYLYLIPDIFIDLSDIRVEYMGILLGEIAKDNFVPSQELIMSLTKDDLKQCLNFDKDDINAVKYLKCETLILSEIEHFGTWIAVCIDSYPVGWMKKTGSILKNQYNKSWRML